MSNAKNDDGFLFTKSNPRSPLSSKYKNHIALSPFEKRLPVRHGISGVVNLSINQYNDYDGSEKYEIDDIKCPPDKVGRTDGFRRH